MKSANSKTITAIIVILAVVCGILSCFHSVYVGTSLPGGGGGYWRSFAHRLVICCGLIELGLLAFRFPFSRGLAIVNALVRLIGPWVKICVLDWILEPIGGHGPGVPGNVLPYLITALSLVSLVLNVRPAFPGNKSEDTR